MIHLVAKIKKMFTKVEKEIDNKLNLPMALAKLEVNMEENILDKLPTEEDINEHIDIIDDDI